MDAQRLRLNQVCRLLRQTTDWKQVMSPPGGWLRSVREALGLTLRQQAARIGIAPATLLVHEKNELDGHITVEQLRKLAAALDCELVYALISKQDLEEVIESRADAIARSEVLGVSHTMALENQKPGNTFEKDQIAERKAELLKGKWAKLWR